MGRRSNTVLISNLFRRNAHLWHGAKVVSMSLCQIRYFVVVAEEKHVGRAARRLAVAQPAMSRQIRNLEEELGARLFDRTPRGMRLLPAGEVFLEHGRAILTQVAAAAQSVRSVSRPSGRTAW
jgi:DNA-binding transcriptional LysR family regulator